MDAVSETPAERLMMWDQDEARPEQVTLGNTLVRIIVLHDSDGDRDPI